MRARWWIHVLVAGSLCLTTGCDDDDDGGDGNTGGTGGVVGGAGGEGGTPMGGTPMGGEPMMTPTHGQPEDIEAAEALWAEIEGHQMTWRQPADRAGWVQGAVPHGANQQYYHNGTDPNADGYTIIKRNYGMEDEGALGALTVMKKMSGFDADVNDWFFVRFNPDGSIFTPDGGLPLAGRPGKGTDGGCVGCHTGAGGDDFLFAFDGDEIPSGPPMGRPWDLMMGQQLWEEIADHESWPVPEGKEGWVEGAMPHGASQRFFHNGEDNTADGYIIIKKNYAEEDEATLGALTVMKRIEGFDGEVNDWFFVRFNPDGTFFQPEGGPAPLVGRPGKGTDGGCVGCHMGAPGGDFLYSFD